MKSILMFVDRYWKVVLILFSIGLLVYGSGLWNEFVWDDEEQIVANQAVHSLANWPLFFQGSTFNTGGANSLGGLYFKPLMTFSYALIYSLFGPRAFFFHLVQLLIHSLNSFLVFLFFEWIFGTVRQKKVSKKTLEQLAFGLSLIFLVHPISVESVSYIASMQEVLFFVFGMSAWLVMIKNKVGWRSVGVVLGLLLASMLSKETGVVFLVAGLALTWLFLKKWRMAWWGMTATVIGCYAFLRFAVAGVFLEKHGLSPITVLSLPERLVSLPKILWFYLKTFFYPQRLVIAQHWVVDKVTSPDFYWPLVFLVVASAFVVGLGWRIWRKHSEWWQVFVFSVLLGGAAMGLHSQFFPLDMTVADRWFYLTQVGLLVLIGCGLIVFGLEIQKYLSSAKYWKDIWIVGGVILVVLSIRSVIRVQTWRDSLTLYAHDSQFVTAFDLENNYGVALFRAGQIDRAGTHFLRSTELAPEWWTNWNNLGALAERAGNDALALEYYEKAIANGQYYLAYENKAKMLARTDATAAITFSRESLQFFPANVTLRQVLVTALAATEDTTAVPEALRLYQLYPTQETYQQYQSLLRASRTFK